MSAACADKPLRGGLCASKPPEWFVKDDMRSWEVGRAKAICAACPVIDRCRELADRQQAELDGAQQLLPGVWAGESEADRAARSGATYTAAALSRQRGRGSGPVQHGTNSCYIYGCRRDECRQAHSAYVADLRRRKRAGEQVGVRVGHGTTTKYRQGCRCKKCSRAHKRAMTTARWMAKRKVA